MKPEQIKQKITDIVSGPYGDYEKLNIDKLCYFLSTFTK